MIRHTLLVFIEALLSSARIAVTCPSISGARIVCAANPPQVPKAMLSILCDTAARFHASRFIRVCAQVSACHHWPVGQLQQNRL